MLDFLKYREVKEDELNQLLEELRTELLESDVSYTVTESLLNDLKTALMGRKLRRGTDVEEVVRTTLKKSIYEIVAQGAGLDLIEAVKVGPKPYVIVFFGINGVGKTTTIAKVAYMMKKAGLVPVVAAADTFRAAAQEQLEYHCKKLEVTLIKGKYGSDPASVAYSAITHAKKVGAQVVLVDTAGRMNTDADLMEELKRVVRISKPNMRILVLDSLAGNDALNQAKAFEENVGYDGVILTKVDADVKGGTILSVAKELGKPVVMLGVGQEYDSLVKFDPEWFVERVFS
nr:signal recognition particle-docking protein FtsY [Sulfodiicoccus acidiphilus]